MATIVIFGGSGDLTKRKIIPAFYHLWQQDLLPEDFSIIGIGRRDLHSVFQENMKIALKEFAQGDMSTGRLNHFLKHIEYFRMSFDDPAGYKTLKKKIGKRDNVIYYLSVSPEYFIDISLALGTYGLNQGAKVVVEKPFGYDEASAKELNDQIGTVFEENSIFRIDHYLGKESVQNIPIFRSRNTIFEAVWNHQYVDNIQITAAETIGVEDRGPFFEKAGTVRDMVQNHLLEIVSLTTMDLPDDISNATAFRKEKIKLLRSIAPIQKENTVRGQYDTYRTEDRVSPTSTAETFVAMKLDINHPRWQGVPVYLRTGKKLNKKGTEVVVTFKKEDRVIISIQPEAGISLAFATKNIGVTTKTYHANMVHTDKENPMSNGYESLLLDIIKGDHTLFVHKYSTEAAWKIVTPLLKMFEEMTPDCFPNYESGTTGPKDADELLERDGRTWYN